ncbi:MAG: hypothetical protein J6I50_10605 [Clostridia bacterium]|nr:hypothetical protein [Clostridia bacterium]
MNETDAIWKKLLSKAKSGDYRSIKLYYDLLEKKEKAQNADSNKQEVMQLSAIRRAVFGDSAWKEAIAALLKEQAEETDTAESDFEKQGEDTDSMQ